MHGRTETLRMERNRDPVWWTEMNVGESEIPCLRERKEISSLKSEIVLQPTISEQSDDPIKHWRVVDSVALYRQFPQLPLIDPEYLPRTINLLVWTIPLNTGLKIYANPTFFSLRRSRS